MPGPKRRSFTPHEQSVADATGYIRTVDRYKRPVIKAYPIDDCDPVKSTDRDDAVSAEKIPGGYRVYVTIADVAAHIPKDSLLDIAAQNRAFTIYRPPARDPMFPFILSEDRFSLEHEQDRLAVTVAIDLDEGFQPTGIEFKRTIINAECLDYSTASDRMREAGDDFELLAHIAKGIRDSSRPQIRPFGDTDFAYMDKTGLLRQADPNTMAAAKLVQVLMIFANNEIAKFFNEAKLPFLYRNHANDPEKMARAEYEPFDRGHYALRSEGLQGSYSHCTSPIRRYADLVNQRMMHYTMDVVEVLGEELAAAISSNSKSTKLAMQSLVWDYANEVFEAIFAVHAAEGHKRVLAEKHLKGVLQNVLEDAAHEFNASVQVQVDIPAKLSAVSLSVALPYTHEELSAITPKLNTANSFERVAITELNRRNLMKWNEKITDDLNAGHFDQLRTAGFSGMLRRAAVTGRMSEAFALEVVERFKTGRVDTVPDCYSILILCKESHDKNWRGLKRLALNAIERDPMVINNIVEKGMKEGEIHPDTYLAEAMVRDSAAESSMPLLQAAGVQQQVDAALIVTYMKDLGGREYAAPHYSVGYSKRDTARHARFNFIRAIAFGELGPLDQTILPTPLFAELSHGRSRAEILLEMADSMDLTIREFGPRERPDGNVSFSYQVYGPGIEHSIVGPVVAASLEEAKEKSATRILRNNQFKRAYANQHPVELGFPSNPMHVVREIADANGWELCEPDRKDIQEVERGKFTASVVLTLAEDDVLEVSFSARNKDNALLYCFESLKEQLEHRGLLPKEHGTPKDGWVTWAVTNRETTPSTGC